MMTLLGDHQFERALDECCGRVLRGELLERCLADYPAEYREELARLVPISTPLGRLGHDPSPEFQNRLERRLLASMDEARRLPEPGVLARLGRILMSNRMVRVAATVLVVLLLLGAGGFGVDRVAANSLPDSPLYRVKAARERLQLVLAQTPEARVAVQASQIAERGTEMERAVQTAKPATVVRMLETRLARATRNMVDQALEREARGNPQPAIRALAVLRAVEVRLDRLIVQARPEQRPELLRARDFIRQQEERLFEAFPRNTPGRAI